MSAKVEKLKKNIPELRFPGFEGEWEEKRLGEVASFLKGRGISKDDVTADGQNKCVRYGELYTEYGEVASRVVSRTMVSSSQSLISMSGDLLIPSSGETAWDIATATCLLEEEVLIGGDLNVLRFHDKNDSRFFAYYLSHGAKRAIAGLAQGNSVVHLYSSHLKSLRIHIPVQEEQQKIASFLTTADEWIVNLKSQKQKWEEYKKGMMQKIFPGGAGQVAEIRFKDEDGNDFPDWEEKRLGEVAIIDPSTSSLPSEFYYIDLESVDRGRLNSYTKLNKDSAPSRAQRVLEKDDILFQTVRPYQQNNLFFDLYGVFVASTGYAQMRAKYNSRFLYHYLHTQSFLRDVLARCTGSNYPAINSSDLKRIMIRFPSEGEQQKIAGLLTAVDEVINFHQQKITFAEEWKKGLMQRMFV